MVPVAKEICPQEAGHHNCPDREWHSQALHASAEIVPAIEAAVTELEEAGFSARETFAVRLALEEALVNAIKHGHRGDPSKEVHFRYHLAPDCFLAEIEDEGPGFRPEAVPDPFAPENLERSNGRGLLLVRSYMTWVRYNSTGNRVTLCRRRGGAEDRAENSLGSGGAGG